MKTQFVRLLDVLVLGPALIAVAVSDKRMRRANRALLVTAGVATIVYNAANYLTAESRDIAPPALAMRPGP